MEDGLTTLLVSSLIVRDQADPYEPRFTMLETIRAYALDLLQQHPGHAQVVSSHAAYYAGLAADAAPQLSGLHQAAWHRRLTVEYPNLRAALQWFLEQPDPTPVLQIGNDLLVFWLKHGWYTDACNWLELALVRAPDAPVLARARAWNMVGRFSIYLGRFAQAQPCLEESARLFQRIGDLGGHGAALINLGMLSHVQGRLTEVQALYAQSLALFRQCTPPDERRISAVLINLGNISVDHADLATARRYYDESLTIQRRLADQALPIVINNMAYLALLQGDLVTVQLLLDEGIQLAERIGDTFSRTLLHMNHGLLALERGDVVAATTQLRLVLETQQVANNPAEQINGIQTLGYIALVEDRVDQADTWLQQAHTLCEALGPNQYSAEVLLQRSRLAMAQGDNAAAWRLVMNTIQLVRARGKRLLLPEVAEQAALVLLRQDAWEQAITLWHTAAASRRTAGIPQLPSLLRWYGDQTAALVTASPDLKPADLDDLRTLLAGLVPPADI